MLPAGSARGYANSFRDKPRSSLSLDNLLAGLDEVVDFGDDAETLSDLSVPFTLMRMRMTNLCFALSEKQLHPRRNVFGMGDKLEFNVLDFGFLEGNVQ